MRSASSPRRHIRFRFRDRINGTLFETTMSVPAGEQAFEGLAWAALALYEARELRRIPSGNLHDRWILTARVEEGLTD